MSSIYSHPHSSSRLTIYLSPSINNIANDSLGFHQIESSDDLILNLICKFPDIFTEHGLMHHSEIMVIEDLLKSVSPSILETLNNQLLECTDENTNLNIWLEILCTDASYEEAQELICKLVVNNLKYVQTTPVILTKLKQWIAFYIVKDPCKAHLVFDIFQKSAIFPPVIEHELLLLLVHMLAQTHGSQAASLISFHLPILLSIIKNDEVILTEAFKSPATFIHLTLTKLLAVFHEKEALELITTAARAKIIAVNEPRFFHLSLHLLSHHFYTPRIGVFQWDLFQQVSRKKLSDTQTGELKKMMTSMPIYQMRTWVVEDRHMQTDLKHLDEASPFCIPQVELNVRLKLVVKALDEGFVDCILPNLYRMRMLAQELGDVHTLTQSAQLLNQLVDYLCHKEWTINDQHTAHAIFEQAANDHNFPLERGLHRLLLIQAAKQSKGKGYLALPINYFLKQGIHKLSLEDTLACFTALEKIGPQKNNASNRQQRILLIQALLEHEQPSQALKLLEHVHLDKNAFYFQLVKEAFALVFTQSTDFKQALEFCEAFFKKINTPPLSSQCLIHLFPILFLSNLKAQNTLRLNALSQLFQEHLADDKSPLWENTFAKECVDICINSQVLEKEMIYFMGDFLGTYASSFRKNSNSVKLVQKILCSMIEQDMEDAKSMMLLLISTYGIENEEIWLYLLKIAQSNKKSLFAKDLIHLLQVGARRKNHLHNELFYTGIYELCASIGSFDEKIGLLKNSSPYLQAFISTRGKKGMMQAVELFDSLQSMLANKPLQEKHKYLNALFEIADNLSSQCALILSNDKKTEWYHFLSNVPAPKTFLSALAFFNEALSNKKPVRTLFHKLITYNYAREEEALYESLVPKAVSLLLQKKDPYVTSLDNIEHLLTKGTKVCDGLAKQLMLTLIQNPIQKDEIHRLVACFNSLISHTTEIFPLEGILTAISAKNSSFFNVQLLQKLKSKIHTQILKIHYQTCCLSVSQASFLGSQKHLETLLQRLTSAEDYLEFIPKIWALCRSISENTSLKLDFLFKILYTTLLFDCPKNFLSLFSQQIEKLILDLVFIHQVLIFTDDKKSFVDFNYRTAQFFESAFINKNYDKRARKWLGQFFSVPIKPEWIDNFFQKSWKNIIIKYSKEISSEKNWNLKRYLSPTNSIYICVFSNSILPEGKLEALRDNISLFARKYVTEYIEKITFLLNRKSCNKNKIKHLKSKLKKEFNDILSNDSIASLYKQYNLSLMTEFFLFDPLMKIDNNIAVDMKLMHRNLP